MATERRVSWIISANVKQWQKGLNKAQRRMDRFGRKMQRTGRSLTQNITMPLATAAAGAIKMGSDFESSLSQAQAQAALTAQQVTFIGDAAKRTAIRTGESTDDIIEAYKFTMSAGMNLAESQKIVGAAAEASAAGFGQQRDLVRMTTTAMQAFNDEVDSGREFMDLLVGAAQVMELEVSKLGTAFQKNVSIAKNLGISMDELLAGIGSVSEIMGDADRGGRLFQTMMGKLLRPSAQAKGAIEGVYGSITNMREAIREDGLLPVMVRLRKELEATSEEGLGMIFSQRGLEAALNLTNREGERTNEILQDMGDTAGSTKDAFDSVADSTERNFRQALRALQVTAIELGEIMLPMVNKVIDAVKEFATSFSQLSEGVKVNALKIAGLLGAGGPILTAVGLMISTLASISWPVVLGVAAAGAAIRKIMANWDTIVAYFSSGDGMKIWDTIKSAAHTTYDTLQSVFDSMEGLFRSASNFLIRVWEVFGSEIKLITKSSLKLVKGALETGLDALALALDVFSARWATDWDGFWADNEERVKRFGENIVDIFLGTSRDVEAAFGTLVIDTENMTVSWRSANEEASKAPEIFRQMKNPIEGFFDNYKEGAGVFKRETDQMISKLIQLQSFLNMDLSAPATSGGSGDSAGSGGEVDRMSFVESWRMDEGTEKLGRFTAKVRKVGEITSRAFDSMKASGAQFATVAEAAGTDVASKFRWVGNVLSDIANRFTDSFGQGMANVVVQGEKLVDTLKNIGKLLLSSAIQKGISVLLTGGLSGVSGFFGAAGGLFGSIFGVNDALITSEGDVINFHPDDNILAMRDFSRLNTGISGSQTIKNELLLDGNTVWSNQRRVNTNKRR